MKVVDQEGDLQVERVLAAPVFAHLATATLDGAPRSSPVWFLWEEGAVWILGQRDEDSFPKRIAERPECALSIVDFDPRTGRVWHVGLRGTATIEAFALERAVRKLAKYLGPDRARWDTDRFGLRRPERLVFVRFVPETVVVRDQSFAPSLGSTG